jgi:hypothetical protein
LKLQKIELLKAHFHTATFINTSTSPDVVIYNLIDHVLTDKRQHSNISDIRSFRGADCDTDHHLELPKLRERISVSKRTRQTFELDRFDMTKLDDVEIKEKYQVEISHRFTALESLDESIDINNSSEVLEQCFSTAGPRPGTGPWDQ